MRNKCYVSGYWLPLSACPLAGPSWCSLCPEAGVLSRQLWLSYQVCSPARPPCNALALFSLVSLQDSLVDTSWDVRRVSGYMSENDSVSTNTLQSILPLPYFISGLPLSWVEVRGDPRATIGQDNNFFRGVSSTTLFHLWTLIAHDHQVSMRQETLHINCCFTYIWLFVFPVIFPYTVLISYLRVWLPWIFVSFNTCSMDHWVSRHSVPPYY